MGPLGVVSCSAVQCSLLGHLVSCSAVPCSLGPPGVRESGGYKADKYSKAGECSGRVRRAKAGTEAGEWCEGREEVRATSERCEAMTCQEDCARISIHLTVPPCGFGFGCSPLEDFLRV